jgi:hypothetical protein
MGNSFAIGTGLKICADGKAVGTGLTLLARHHDGEAVPTVVVGTDLHVPTIYLCRRLTCWPGRN